MRVPARTRLGATQGQTLRQPDPGTRGPNRHEQPAHAEHVRAGAELSALNYCIRFIPKEDVRMAANPLSAWNDGPAWDVILDFVARVTKTDGRDYVPPGERIATFDNDGTL